MGRKYHKRICPPEKRLTKQGQTERIFPEPMGWGSSVFGIEMDPFLWKRLEIVGDFNQMEINEGVGGVIVISDDEAF